MRVVSRMVPVFFFVTLLVRAGIGFRMGHGIVLLAIRTASGCHSQYVCSCPIQQFIRLPAGFAGPEISGKEEVDLKKWPAYRHNFFLWSYQ
jgi:hypothetical protein